MTDAHQLLNLESTGKTGGGRVKATGRMQGQNLGNSGLGLGSRGRGRVDRLPGKEGKYLSSR
jgi:hypothetical protein